MRFCSTECILHILHLQSIIWNYVVLIVQSTKTSVKATLNREALLNLSGYNNEQRLSYIIIIIITIVSRLQ